MADAPNEVRQQTPVATGGMSVARLSSEELPANPKRVIRTFASDMAALKGEPAPVPTPAPTTLAPVAPPPPAPRPAPVRMPPPMQPPIPAKASLAEAVGRINVPQASAPEPHLPPLRKPSQPMYVRRPESVPPPLPRQPVPLSEGVVHETGPSLFEQFMRIFFGVSQQGYVPPPLPRPVLPPPPPIPRPVAPPPLPTPQPHVEAPIAEAVPSTSAAEQAAERNAVLARLRERVAGYGTQAVPPPPVFPTPAPAPAVRPRGSAPANLPGAENASPPERLRTFSSDFSTETSTRGESAFSILAAQADAPRSVETTVEARRPVHGLAYALAGTFLVVGGSLALYFSYNYFAARAPVSVISSAPAGRISGDDSTTIEGTGSVLMTALANAANVQIAAGNVRLIYLTVSSSTPTGTETLTLGGTDILKALQLPAPSILLRNIGAGSSVGVVHAGDETRTFFVLSANSYERTFAGMLSWEPSIGQDLGQLYPTYGAVGTSTLGAPHFVDEIVQSHDVRALKDGANRTILVYGFRDQTTLIIARDETAFGILLARLSASQ